MKPMSGSFSRAWISWTTPVVGRVVVAGLGMLGTGLGPQVAPGGLDLLGFGVQRRLALGSFS